jgi:hypothetical protein
MFVPGSTWERGDPLIHVAYPTCDGVTSDAFDTRWARPLADGTFALITRTYYLVDRKDGRYMEEETEYLICRDLADPGGTEEHSEGIYRRDDDATDPEQCATHAEEPDDAEWFTALPSWWVS